MKKRQGKYRIKQTSDQTYAGVCPAKKQCTQEDTANKYIEMRIGAYEWLLIIKKE
jgi:hypothetical protein